LSGANQQSLAVTWSARERDSGHRTGVAVPLIHTQQLLHPDNDSFTQSFRRAIVIDCAFGSCLLAVETINTLSDLSSSQRHTKLPAEYPAQFIEYSCESNGVTVGVIKVATLFQLHSEHAIRKDGEST